MITTNIRTTVSAIPDYLPERSALVRAGKSIVPYLAAAGTGFAAYKLSPEFRAVVDRGRDILNGHQRVSEMASSAIFLGVIPDFLAQKYDGLKFSFRRWGGMAALGAVNGGIILRTFYNSINNAFPGISTYAVTERVLIDQFIFSPPSLFALLVAANYIEGKSTAQLLLALKEKYPELLAYCWGFWLFLGCPLVNLTQPDIRVVTANVLSIMWMSVLSKILHNNN